MLVDRNDKVLEFSSRSIPHERPSIGHLSKDPNRWFEALLDGFDELSSKAEKDMKRVEGIGLSGHMHSAILMDSTDKPRLVMQFCTMMLEQKKKRMNLMKISI